ncbi:phosphoribosyl-AMP cyclohydrolase [Crateriforma conspicua]|uniref:Phosphoribosyl-AMP cyclohydrolase n=2 Tax=Planctomycetaceae TaxID=126 RepID=A0A5C6FMH4_9PLAN|nr:phosphoribosyl-AMP cyclohydrolase [Crateriforma conspicua]
MGRSDSVGCVYNRGMTTPKTTETETAAMPNFDAGANGLLPAIAQDAQSGRVLMMAWMNAEAFEETLQTGQATYYSRSRGKLWRKGETSGHRQRVREVRIDCDADAILLKVDQVGAACHEGFASCFFRVVDSDGGVREVEKRLVDPAEVYGDASRKS